METRVVGEYRFEVWNEKDERAFVFIKLKSSDDGKYEGKYAQIEHLDMVLNGFGKLKDTSIESNIPPNKRQQKIQIPIAACVTLRNLKDNKAIFVLYDEMDVRLLKITLPLENFMVLR